MRRGLGARLAIAFALLAALTALVTAGVSTYSTSRQVNGDVDRFLADRSLDIAEGRRARGNNEPSRNSAARELAGDLRALVDSDAEVRIIGRDGRILVASGAALPFEEVDERFLDRRAPVLLRTVEIDGESYRMATRHFEGGGAVQVARSLTTTNALLGELRTELLLVGLLMSGVAGLVGWQIARQTTKPLRRLTESVEAVGITEDLSTPLTLDRDDEIGRLSEEFDSLLKTLSASRDQQQRLIQDAAHELRTPLTSVRANVSFLEHARDLPEQDRSAALTSIKAELAELSEVLAEVVELATESRGAATFEDLDLASVAEAALAQFELRSARPVIRQLTPARVRGHHDALVRATQNLIANADKYSPEGSPVTVIVKGGSLWVEDHGPGIPPEDRTRIFDRFYRVDRDRSAPGSGLGLAIVSKTAQEHGGTVWAREADSGGAAIGYTLPTTSAS